MNIFAIDASSENVSFCIKVKGKIAVDFNRRVKFGASNLVSYIDKSIRKAEIDLRCIDAFVIGAGPGSFTGLRISFSIIKAFMAALDKPAVSVGSFFSCAYALSGDFSKVAVVSDARRGFVYLSCFQVKGGLLKAQGKDRLVTIDEVADKKEYTFASYDPLIKERIVRQYPQIRFYPKNVYPRAKNLLPFVEQNREKIKFTDGGRLEPIYLHPKTCQVRKHAEQKG